MNRSFARAAVAAVLLLAGACAPRERASAPADFNAGYVTTANGGRLWYGLLGQGPDTILVVPGGPALPHGYLTTALAPLARTHALLFVDLRGRGLSDPVPPEAPGITGDTDARDLLGLLDSLALRRVHAIGHHYGALVLLHLAQRDSSRLGRVAFIAPEPATQVAVFDLSSDLMDTAATRRYAQDFRDSLFARDELEYCRRHWGFQLAPVEELGEPVVAALRDSVCAAPAAARAADAAIKGSVHTGRGGNFNYVDSVRAVNEPLLVVQGHRDRIYLFWSRLYAAVAPDGRMLELDGSPLFPWLDRPAEFADALGTFFGGSWPGGAVRPAVATRRPGLDSIPLLSADDASR